MKFTTIIFDLDGTIIDTNHIWNKATYDLVTSRGVTLTPEIEQELAKNLKGMAIHHSCAHLKHTFDLEHSLEELMAEKKKRAHDQYMQGLRFIAGFEEFFKKVQSHGLKVGVATNAENHTLATAIELLKLREFFGEHIYNFTFVNNVGKPAPDVYLFTAKQLGVKPEECLVIEDAAHGIEAANKAGMFAIGINTAGNRNDLKEAKFVVDNYHEIDLPRLLKLKKEVK